jgi:hypothetical protein
MQILSLRLPRGLIEEIDRYAEELQGDSRFLEGLQITRTDAIRHLIARGLQTRSSKRRKEG